MSTLIHSPFLQALGYAIINSLWQFALLWLVYVSVNTIVKLTSTQKFVTGMVLQTAGFGWFIVTLVFYYRQYLLLFETGYTVDLLLTGNTTLKEKFIGWILETENILPYLSIAYLSLLIILCIKWLKSYRYAQVIRMNGVQKIDVELRLFVQRISYELGIKKTIGIYISEIIKTPLTVGFFKPIILIPLASLNHLSAEQMEAVIIHELAHIKRLDYLSNLFLAVIEAVLFFNPFMQLISRQIKRERENCCDDRVLQYEYNAATYARALLQIATYQTQSPSFALKATDDKHILLGRIKRMIEKKEKTFFNYRHQLLALFVMTVVFSTLSFLSPGNKKSSSAVNTATLHSIKMQPLVATVDNPLFNPVFFLTKEEKPVAPKKSGILVSERKSNAGVSSVAKKATPVDEIKEVQDNATLIETENEFFAAEENKTPVLKAFENTNIKPFAPFVFHNNVQPIREKELSARIFTTINGIATPKKEMVEKQQQVRELKSALAKVKSVKSQLESSVRNVTVSTTNSITKIIINLRQVDLAEQKMEEQLNEQIITVNNDDAANAALNTNFNFQIKLPQIIYAASLQNINLPQIDTLQKANEILEKVEFYKPASKEPTKIKVTKKGKAIYITRI
ncbi:MAG TPA: M56 family metallopeptidase [Segetibacter sp.]